MRCPDVTHRSDRKNRRGHRSQWAARSGAGAHAGPMRRRRGAALFPAPRRRAVAVRGAPSAGGARHDGPGRHHPAGVDPGYAGGDHAHTWGATHPGHERRHPVSTVDQRMADYESQFRASVLQNVLIAQAFVPEMIRHRYGRFIAISTECVMQHLPGQSAYVAGKRGMDGVLRVLAKEIGPYQITVNQVAPGWTITEEVRRAGTQRQDAYEAAVPLKRRGEDQEIANVVAFLASDLASYITGAYIPVCGGNVMPAI